MPIIYYNYGLPLPNNTEHKITKKQAVAFTYPIKVRLSKASILSSLKFEKINSTMSHYPFNVLWLSNLPPRRY